jgi:hypothetical protein
MKSSIFLTFIKIWAYPLSHFQHFLTCWFCLYIFRNPFLIFFLDKQHPLWLEKLPMSALLRISSSPMGVFNSRVWSPFSYPSWCIQLVDFWLYFPGLLKVGKNSPYSSFSIIWGRWLWSWYNTEYDYSDYYYFLMFSLAVFVDEVRVH